MLLLLFEIAETRFALDAGDIIQVIPNIPCEKISSSQSFIAGVISFHGNVIPVIDLCCFHKKVHCKSRLSTRIIIVNYIRDDFKNVHIGLIAERVTETVRVDDRYLEERDFQIDMELIKGKQGEGNAMVQWYDLDHLLSEDLLDEIVQE